MHLRTLCETRPKQYPLKNSPAFRSTHDPGTALASNFRITFYRSSTPSFRVLIYCLLGFIRGLSKAISSGLHPEKPRNAFSPEYDHPRAYILFRHKDSTAVTLNRTPQCALFWHTFSNSCFDQTPAVCHHMAEAEAVVAWVCHHLPAETHPILM